MEITRLNFGFLTLTDQEKVLNLLQKNGMKEILDMKEKIECGDVDAGKGYFVMVNIARIHGIDPKKLKEIVME
jgi:hypothetical protein